MCSSWHWWSYDSNQDGLWSSDALVVGTLSYLISCLQLCDSSVCCSPNDVKYRLLIDSRGVIVDFHSWLRFLGALFLHLWHMRSTIDMRVFLLMALAFRPSVAKRRKRYAWWWLCIHHHPQDQLELGVADVLAISLCSGRTLGNRGGSLQNFATATCFSYFRCSYITFGLSGGFQNKLASLRALLLHPDDQLTLSLKRW